MAVVYKRGSATIARPVTLAEAAAQYIHDPTQENREIWLSTLHAQNDDHNESKTRIDDSAPTAKGKNP